MPVRKKTPRRGVFQFLLLKKSGCLNIRCLLALWALRDFELDFLTFFEGLEAVHVDCREVRKQIFTTIVWRNEAKTFGIIEPLDCTCCHKNKLSVKTIPAIKAKEFCFSSTHTSHQAGHVCAS